MSTSQMFYSILWKDRGTKVGPSALFGAHASDRWWTQARLDKLRYVMETYNDLDKASRVLGAPKHTCARQWSWMKTQDKRKATHG